MKKEKEGRKEKPGGEGVRDSRILHNNWIINSQVLKEGSLKSQKQPSSKSVIMVKPNHSMQSTETQSVQRTSVKKSNSERKP